MAKAKAVKNRKLVVAGVFLTKLDKVRDRIQDLEAHNLAENKRIERLKSDAALMERLAAQDQASLARYRTTFITWIVSGRHLDGGS